MRLFSFPGKSINFMRLSIADNYFILLLGMAAFLTQLGLLHILRYSKTISILGATLKNSASDVANVLVCIAVLMTGFAGFMHVLYGPHMYDYRSVLATFAAMFSGFLGNFDYQGVTDATGILGGIMLLAYLMVMMNVYLNFFISILSEYMSALRSDPNAVPKDHEVIAYMMTLLESAVGSEKNEDREKRKRERRARE